VHLAPHPVWFWILLAVPCLASPVWWIAANTLKVSLKKMAFWLWAGYLLCILPYLFLFDSGNHKKLRFVLGILAWTCYITAFSVQRHYMFESLLPPGTKWYFPWKAAPFSIQTGTRILVKNIDAVSPWYTEQLGLRKLAENPIKESGAATFKFKRDGNPIVLTTRSDFRTGKTPILFTKKIGKMQQVMAARGVNVGDIRYDRQGIQYFAIRDPEGNEIEVVEER